MCPTERFHGAGRKGGSPPGPPVRNPGGRVPSPKGVTIRCRVRWLAPDRGQGGNGHAKFGRDLGPRRYAVQTFFEGTQAADGSLPDPFYPATSFFGRQLSTLSSRTNPRLLGRERAEAPQGVIPPASVCVVHVGSSPDQRQGRPPLAHPPTGPPEHEGVFGAAESLQETGR